jgi:tetratricopeptide (TPR) repeat protein
MAPSNELLDKASTYTRFLLAIKRLWRAALRDVTWSALSLAAMQVAFAEPPRPDPDVLCDTAPVMTEHDGALDYRLRFVDERVRSNVALLDKFHTWPARQALASGQRGPGVIGDLDFSLRHSPNHHEALKLLVDYDRADGGKSYEYAPIPCYFEWARHFAPNDATVLGLNALYYWRHDLRRSAELFDAALALEPTSPELNYNAGLLYFELGNYARARRHAHAAYGGGFPLPGLRTRLQKAGEWAEPETAPSPAVN